MITLNGHAINPTMFPDKTSQIWHLNPLPKATHQGNDKVVWYFESEEEFMWLAQLRWLCSQPHLYIPYLPYGRQDKETSNDTTFALRPFCSLLNSLGFHRVEVFDPHSYVACSLLTRGEPIVPHDLIEGIAREYTYVLFPDKGASTRYTLKHQDKYNCVKVRDQSTGRITDIKIPQNLEKQSSVLVVDDLCDGGATFIELAKTITKHYGDTMLLDLYVTHGIFSQGFGPLLKHYETIYTTNSFFRQPKTNDHRVKIYESVAPYRLVQSRPPIAVPS